MRPTSIRMLLLVALVAALVGWQLAAWIDSVGRLPAIPWLAVIVVWLLAGFVGVWALVARRRLHPRPGGDRMAPLVAARTAALALAGSRTGAVFFGLYAGMALRLLEETSVAAGRQRLLAAVIAAVGGFVLTGLSLWLEHLCRLPEDPADGAAGIAGPSAAPGASA